MGTCTCGHGTEQHENGTGKCHGKEPWGDPCPCLQHHEYDTPEGVSQEDLSRAAEIQKRFMQEPPNKYIM